MPELIIHDICAIDQADCRLAIEFAGAKHLLYARRISSDIVPSIGEFEPAPLFRDLQLSPFQIQQLVSSSTKIRRGGRLTFPFSIPESRTC
jgi:hypothetical protein